MIQSEFAWELLERRIKTLSSERVPRRSATGRVLAEPVAATLDVPTHDVSAMDGFAIAGSVDPGSTLPLTGTIAAGDRPGSVLEAGTALRIMTGAPVPDGADRIVPVELTNVTDNTVAFDSSVEAGAHIRLGGEVVRRGEQILHPGMLLTPGAQSLLATHGLVEVSTYRRPRVAFLATGDEVVPANTQPIPGQLRDSHTDFLIAAGHGLGLEIQPLGIAPDNPRIIADRIREGMAFDVLLVGGGVSMGEFDYVESILADLDCDVLFDKVAIQPGKPLVAAHHGTGFVFGLPGNPASVMVGFWLFVRPLLRCLQGMSDGFWQGALRAELAGEAPGAKGRDRFLSAETTFEKGRILVTPSWAKGSHDVAAYARGMALVRIPAHSKPLAVGAECEILPFSNWPSVSGRTPA